MQLTQITDEIIRLGITYPEYVMGSLIPFLPLVVGVYQKKYASKSSNFIFCFIVFFIISDIPIWITTALKIHNSILVYTRAFSINIFLLLVYFIRINRKSDKKILTVYLLIMTTGLLLQLFGIIKKGQYTWVNGLLLGSVAVWYFVRLLEYPKVKDIIVYPFFWFNSGILFYCFSTLLIFFFFQYSINSDIKSESYFLFKSILEYLTSVMFVLFAVGFWNLKRNSQISIK
jgi:hypothetical protein